ncbi:MAG: cellulase family glycosylhydrolase [Oscillospiraceae bacterium]|nr:cellulase family glycosylhydrolase [Oscillospiraceae bacterium]
MKANFKKILAFFLLLAVIITSLSIGAAAAETPMLPINVQEQRFVDSEGRERIFHGINYVVDKYGGPENLDDAFFAEYAARGFNSMRLGLYWVMLEPEPDQFDWDYIAAIDPVFKAAEKHGVYLMLELHQDLYGRGAAGYGGKGAPDWACLIDGAKLQKRQYLVWAEGYFWGKGVHNAFDNFWNNTEAYGKGLQEHYAEIWAMLAERYGGSPALLGYNFFNEPHPGTDGGKVFRKLIWNLVKVMIRRPRDLGEIILSVIVRGERLQLLNFLDGDTMRQITSAGDELIRKFDVEKYTPFLEKMTNAVREKTDKGIIFMDNSYFSNLSIPYSVELPRVNGEIEPNVAFAPHGYDLVVDTDMYDKPGDDRVLAIFKEHRRSQERLNVPVLVGEWGGGWYGTPFVEHCRVLTEFFDENGWSFAYYGDWRLRGHVLDFLVRPYPMAVNGTDVNYRYDHGEGVFTLSYTQGGGDAPTIIYLPWDMDVDADGMDIKIVPAGGNSYPDARYVLLTGGAGTQIVTITLDKAP